MRWVEEYQLKREVWGCFQPRTQLGMIGGIQVGVLARLLEYRT